MNMTVTEFYKLSPWEFQAACDGWMKAHSDTVAPPTDADFDRAFPEHETVN